MVTGFKKMSIFASEFSFTERVHAVVRRIPKGQTRSYGEVASQAGSPGAARAVGSILKKNYDPTIPCHRVIRANGSAGEYNRGLEKKKRLLQSEGVKL